MTLQARSQSFMLSSLHHNENFLEAAKKQQEAKKAVTGTTTRAGVPLANITNTQNAGQQKPGLKQQPVNKPNQIIGPASVQQQQLPKMTFVTSRVTQSVAPPVSKLPDLPLPNIGQLNISGSNNYSDFSPMTIDEDLQSDSGSESGSVEEESSAEDVVDIDYWDADDPRAASEYVEDIYDYLRKRELQFRLQPNFLTAQIDIKEKMRLVLLDWFVEVHFKFQLLTETLFIAANILDRYLALKQVSRNNLQLVGMGALFIAAKYEEMYPPCCDDFVYMSDGTYTKDDLLEMEGVILNTLQFNISVPLPIHFLRRYNKASGTEFKTYCLCRYILELSLFDVQMHKFTPSEIAAAAFYLARIITKESLAWTPTLAHHTKLEEHQVKPIALELHASVVKFHKAPLTALKTKFSKSEYERVALMPELH